MSNLPSFKFPTTITGLNTLKPVEITFHFACICGHEYAEKRTFPPFTHLSDIHRITYVCAACGRYSYLATPNDAEA